MKKRSIKEQLLHSCNPRAKVLGNIRKHNTYSCGFKKKVTALVLCLATVLCCLSTLLGKVKKGRYALGFYIYVDLLRVKNE